MEAYSCGLSDCYSVGPTFRPNHSVDHLHLSEFWMVEPEMAFADIDDAMSCTEGYLKYCVNYLLKNNKDDMAFIDRMRTIGNKTLLNRLNNLVK